MNKSSGKILKGISITFNILFLLLLLFSFFMKKPSSISFFDMSQDGKRYATGAAIVSVPAEGADLVFSVPEFSLKIGGEALLQFSVYADKHQVNMTFSPLYDHALISIEQTGLGMIIRALRPGETVLQNFTDSGIKDIARVLVTE